MRNIQRSFFSALFILCGFQVCAQQTVQFTQYVFNGLVVNPAYAGYKEDWNANLSYRAQWSGIKGGPRTAVASFDGVTNNEGKRVGLGLVAINDRIGAQSTSSLYGNYAYRLQIDDNEQRRLSFGIAFGVTQYGIDGSKLIAVDPNDPGVPVGNQNKTYPDIRVGIHYSDPKFFLGASVLDMFSANRDQITTDDNYRILKQVRHLYLTGGAMLPLSYAVDFRPSFMIKEDFNGPTNLDLNAAIILEKTLAIGGSYRTGLSIWKKGNLQSELESRDAFAAIFEVFVSERFRIGYSFDYSTNALGDFHQGSHEISLGISFGKKGAALADRRFF
ncbi:MAG: type IX secretion system membrane protein PorP/SprF [Bacteroidota bacterium]